MIYCHTVIHTGPPPAALHVVYMYTHGSYIYRYIYICLYYVCVYIHIYNIYVHIYIDILQRSTCTKPWLPLSVPLSICHPFIVSYLSLTSHLRKH